MHKIRFELIIAAIAFITILFASYTINAQTDITENLQCTVSSNLANKTKTYLVGSGKRSKKERTRLEEEVGIAIPGEEEIKAAIERRKSIVSARQKRVDELENNYARWIKDHPNATAEEKEKWRKLTDDIISSILSPTRDKERLAMKSFDWRGVLDVGKVLDQGDCNTCWAFASIDAAAASLRKRYFDSISGDFRFTKPDKPGIAIDISTPPPFDFPGDPRPFVQDLLNCMPLNEQEICEQGWHGKAFNFMVDNGIPTSYDGLLRDNNIGITHRFERKYSEGKKLACDPNHGYYQVFAWDYVNPNPEELPTVQILKEALIEHGPLVAPIFRDECLIKYRGGIFNEENLQDINHVVLLIGWDDEKEAWLVKNSYGEEWGEKGFAWIKYGSNNIGLFAAWIDSDSDYSTFKSSPSDPLYYLRKQNEGKCGIDTKDYFDSMKEIDAVTQNGLNNPRMIYNDDTITIEGEVKTKQIRKKVLKIAKKYQKKNKCFKRVVNNLTIAEPN